MFKVKRLLLPLGVPGNNDVEAFVLHYFGERRVLAEVPVPFISLAQNDSVLVSYSRQANGVKYSRVGLFCVTGGVFDNVKRVLVDDLLVK